MSAPTKFFVCSSSRALRQSSRSLTTTDRYALRSNGARNHTSYNPPVRSHRLLHNVATKSRPSLPTQIFAERYHQIGAESKRYFSGKGKELNGVNGASDGDIDRSKFTHEVKVEMPDVGQDAEGVIETWYKKEGDLIKREEVICDVRTEQFTFGMMTDDDYDSIMGEILIPEESEPVKPGTHICITLNERKGDETEGKEKEEE